MSNRTLSGRLYQIKECTSAHTNRLSSAPLITIEDKAGPSGDYDGSNTSILESRNAMLLALDEVYDVSENLKKLNSFKRGYRLQDFSGIYDITPSEAAIDYCAVRIDHEGLKFTENVSPNSSHRANSSNKFRSITSYNLSKDFYSNSHSSEAESENNKNSTERNLEDYFLSESNTVYVNPFNAIPSKSTINPSELNLDLTESPPPSSRTCSSSGLSPIIKKAHLSSDDVIVKYEIHSNEIHKVGPVNNWHTNICEESYLGRSGSLTARCVEVPPKRMRIRLNTPRYSKISPLPPVENYCTAHKTCMNTRTKDKPDVCIVKLEEDAPEDLTVEQTLNNFEIRKCLSAVDLRCDSFDNLVEPRNCKSNATSCQETISDIKNLPIKTTKYFRTSTGESFTEISSEIQKCINSEDDTKKSLSNKSSVTLSQNKSKSAVSCDSVKSEHSNLIIANESSSSSESNQSGGRQHLKTSLYPPSKKQSSHVIDFRPIHPTRLTSKPLRESYSKNHEVSHHSRDEETVKDLIEHFNEEPNPPCKCCQVSEIIPRLQHNIKTSYIADNHCSLSRPSTTTTTSCSCSCDQSHLHIDIPSSIGDDAYVNASRLEPNITTIENDISNKFRFWRFKRKNRSRHGSGDTSLTDASKTNRTDYQWSQSSTISSPTYIVSPAKTETYSNPLSMKLIKHSQKPDVKSKKSSKTVIKPGESHDSVANVEKELNIVNYSDFCLPIKSLEKLPDENSVKDILKTLSQNVFKNNSSPSVEEDLVDEFAADEAKEDLILTKFSIYSQFKTRAELLAESIKENMDASKKIKDPSIRALPQSNDSNDSNYYLNTRKVQNTSMRYYEIPSPVSSGNNMNKAADSNKCHEHHHHNPHAEETAVKIDDEDDEIDRGFCSNCFCRHLLFPKVSRNYFL